MAIRRTYYTITGSSFSGSDGAASRTYTIPFTSIQANTLAVFTGRPLLPTTEFTLNTSTSLLTVIINLFDADTVLIYFDWDDGSSTTNSAYGTTLGFAQFLGIEGTVPDRTVDGNTARSIENFGTGDNSTTIFYLTHAYVLANSYALSYGAAATSTTALTETTHYTVDKDLGKVTLTASGVTAVGTAKMWASYSFVKIAGESGQFTDTLLQDALDRAAAEIDGKTDNHFVDSTASTPDWEVVANEEQRGKGVLDKDYYLKQFPLPDVSTALNGSFAAAGTTMTVDSTNGFPSSGYLGLGAEKVTYTGKTSTTFTGCSGTSTAHSDDDPVYPYVIEISTTDSGSEPSWVALERDIDYDLKLDAGRVHIYSTLTNFDPFSHNSLPPRLVPNRMRASYVWGTDSIPDDIQKLTYTIAAKEFIGAAVRKALMQGNDSFTPQVLGFDDAWIADMIESYRNIKTDNV